MSPDDRNHSVGLTLEGRKFRPKNYEELCKLVDLAFDYRGDVTIELQSGELLEGYIYDRNDKMAVASLKLFPKDHPGSRSLNYEEIVSLFFSGEDTAFGKSWEEWVNKSKQLSEKKEST